MHAATTVPAGTQIIGNGAHIGTIVRNYEGRMYEVRYTGGLACHDLSGCDILRSDFRFLEPGYAYRQHCHLCSRQAARVTEQLRGTGPHNPICDTCLRNYRIAE